MTDPNRIPERFYRLLPASTASLEGLRSNAELGLEPRRPLSADQAPLWTGLSMFDSLNAALDQRSRSAWLGDFVAAVRLVGLNDDQAKRTTRADGHWTVWLPAQELFKSEVAIIRVG